MSTVITELQSKLDPKTVDSISQKLGTDRDKTEQAIGALVPMLIGGMSQNVRGDRDAARSLNSALERDHDGSLLDGLSGMLAGGGGASGDLLGSLLGSGATSRATNAGGILDHILGPKQDAVTRGVSRASGLGTGQVSDLMRLLAPMVMGALGKAKRQQNLDDEGVKNLLERERSELEEQAPETQQGGLLRVLDSNRDGKVDMADDVAKVGMALGSAFLLSRRGRR